MIEFFLLLFIPVLIALVIFLISLLVPRKFKKINKFLSWAVDSTYKYPS